MKIASVAVDPGPPWALYVVDENGRLWRGEGRVGQARLRWTWIDPPSSDDQQREEKTYYGDDK